METLKTHPLAQSKSHFGISEKLQELICLMGQSQVFEDGENLFYEMMGISMGAKQIQRVCEYYGEQIEEENNQAIDSGASLPEKNTVGDKQYVMVDGSMILTREKGWREIKVGRIFSESDCISVQANRKEITQSEYICHLGEHEEFLRKMEWRVEAYVGQKICVADGAKWIWNWVEGTYPEMIQILDFYHAVEKLGHYARYQIEDEKERKRWLSKQKKALRKNKVNKIIEFLEIESGKTPEAEKARLDVIRYYKSNQKRMQYKSYLEAGYLIGSGAIESAHRNIVQQRLKLSGQRWSEKGAQQIVNLRANHKSNRWEEVISLIRKAA